jgi:hypothetical protein
MHRLLVLLLLASAPPTYPWSPEYYPRVRGEHGLWIGSLHLCGADAARISRGKDRFGEDTLTFTFAPSIQPRLERETTRLLNRPMRVRVDGVTVGVPFVNEPIRGAELMMYGPEGKVTELIERAAAAPC